MTVAQETKQGSQSALGLAASTVIKTGSGRVARVSITTAGAIGAIYDAASVGAAGAANLIGSIPATVGVYYFDFPFNNGLIYIPGSAQVASISYS